MLDQVTRWNFNADTVRLRPNWAGGGWSDLAHGLPFPVGINDNDQVRFTMAANRLMTDVYRALAAV